MLSRCYLLILVCWLALPIGLSAQITFGTIDYTERMSFDFGDWMPADRKKELEAQMASGAFDMTGRVSFNDTEFSYQQLPPEEVPDGRRGGWMMRRAENPEIFYINLADSTRTDRRQIMDRSFILNEAWAAPNWNIAKRKVGMSDLPLPNQLATAITAEGDTLTAYFTESIPLSIGPKGYGGLPGAIIYLKVQNEGRSVEYRMKGMQPNAPDVIVTRPDDAKEISREDFDKEQQRAKEARERRMREWRRSRG